MLTVIGQAAQGINAGFTRLDAAANRIARNGAGNDLPESVVDVMRARHDVGANAAVLRTADEVIGSLLDVLA